MLGVLGALPRLNEESATRTRTLVRALAYQLEELCRGSGRLNQIAESALALAVDARGERVAVLEVVHVSILISPLARERHALAGLPGFVRPQGPVIR